jgi:hypothetical protein
MTKTTALGLLSLASLLLTIVTTGVHHVFRLGPELILPVVTALVLATALFVLYRRTGRRGFLAAYTAFAGLIIFWFGFLDGFLDHVVKAVGLENVTFLPGSDEAIIATVYKLGSQEATTAFYEGTGVLSALFALAALVSTALYLAAVLGPYPAENAGTKTA